MSLSTWIPDTPDSSQKPHPGLPSYEEACLMDTLNKRGEPNTGKDLLIWKIREVLLQDYGRHPESNEPLPPYKDPRE